MRGGQVVLMMDVGLEVILLDQDTALVDPSKESLVLLALGSLIVGLFQVQVMQLLEVVERDRSRFVLLGQGSHRHSEMAEELAVVVEVVQVEASDVVGLVALAAVQVLEEVPDQARLVLLVQP